MAREQTIVKLKALYTNAVAAMLRADACGDDESSKVMTEYAETLDSAIKALETALQTDGDCISRQAAIDEIEERKNVNGYSNVALISELNRLEGYIMRLPSVQPEIIHCRDCRWRKDQSGSTEWLPCRAIVTPSDFYCGRAERRTDE